MRTPFEPFELPVPVPVSLEPKNQFTNDGRFAFQGRALNLMTHIFWESHNGLHTINPGIALADDVYVQFSKFPTPSRTLGIPLEVRLRLLVPAASPSAVNPCLPVPASGACEIDELAAMSGTVCNP